MKSIGLGPFRGINNQAEPGSDVFFSRRTREGTVTPAAVRGAMDVDLSLSGDFISRDPSVLVTALTNPLGLWEVGGKLAYQDGPDFYYDNTKTVTGLTRRLVHTRYWGGYFFTDGSTHFELDPISGVVKPWGLPVPTIDVSPVGGQLPVGTYMVKATLFDATGNEGGASDAAVVTLTSPKGIAVSVSDTKGAALVGVYCSHTDAPEPVLIGTYPLEAFPITISIPPEPEAAIVISDRLRGPLSDAAGLGAFRGFLMLWRGNRIFRSEAAEPHVFYPRNFMSFPGDVTSFEATEAGMWIGTTDGLFWVTGEDPKSWVPRKRLPDAIAAGSTLVEDYEVPFIRTKGRVALFVSPESGIIAGLEDGTTAVFSEYIPSSVSTASFGMVEHGDYRRFVIALNS